MKRLPLILLLVPIFSVSGVASAAAAEPSAAVRATEAQQAKNRALGARLVNQYFTLLVAKDIPGLRAFLSPAFQVFRANGTGGNNRNQQLAAISNSTNTTDAYVLSDIRATRSGPSVVVRYNSSVTQTISGVVSNTRPAPRLSAFVLTAQQGWKLLSHANFNPPG